MKVSVIYQLPSGYEVRAEAEMFWEQGGHGIRGGWVADPLEHVWLQLPVPCSRGQRSEDAFDLLECGVWDTMYQDRVDLTPRDLDAIEDLLVQAAHDIAWEARAG